MSFLRRRISRRFPVIGRLGDVMLVGNAGLRFAHRKGIITDDMAKRFGATTSSGGSGLSAAEMALVAGAAVRLLGRTRSRKTK